MVFIYVCSEFIFFNLLIRGYLPEKVLQHDSNIHTWLHILLVFDYFGCYSKYTFNLLVKQPIYLLLITFFFVGNAENYVNPENGKKLETREQK